MSFERLLSGPGIELIYRALADRAGTPVERAGRARNHPPRAGRQRRRCAPKRLEAFCAMLGTAAANLAVTQGAFGGIYIGGGIVPRLGEFFDRSGFRARFEDKGRFSDYMQGIPTYVITAEDATFMGASAILSAQLRRAGVERGLDHPRPDPRARAAACRRPSSASPTTCWRIRARR